MNSEHTLSPILEEVPMHEGEREPVIEEHTTENTESEQEELHNELLSLIKVLKPAGVDLEEYESEVMQELYDDVKKIQMAKGVLTDNPDTIAQDMKELLHARLTAVAEDARDYNRKERPDEELVKKAKIALIAEGDYSDITKYFGQEKVASQIITLPDLQHYLNGKISTENLDAFVKTPLGKNIARTQDYELSSEYVESFPESFVEAYALYDGEKNYEINFLLKSASVGMYSQHTFDLLIEKKYGRYAIEHIDKFHLDSVDAAANSVELFGHNIQETLESVKRIENSNIKQTLLEKGVRTFLASGHYYNINEGITKFDLPENFLATPEMQDAAYKGIIIGLTEKNLTLRDIAIVSEITQMPLERLQTSEMKEAAGVHMKEVLLHSSYFSDDLVKMIEQLKGLFSLSQEEIQEHAVDMYPEVAIKVGSESLAHYIQNFNLPPEVIQSPEMVEKAMNAILKASKTLDFDSIDRLEKVFPEIKNNFSKRASSKDIAFEKLVENLSGNIEADNKENKIERCRNIQASFWVTEEKEKLPPSVLETVERFSEKYGKKGEALVALAIAGSGLANSEALARKMTSIEQVLDHYDPRNIPAGAHVSMGIEYEVTSSIADAYGTESALGYKKDITLISSSANIGIGRDGVHEIAVKPTYNPYMLLAEVKLLQDAEMLDLNFEKYSKAARGYHLSLVGDGGLKVDENMHFLHNVLTMTQLTGALGGREIGSTKHIHAKNFELFSATNQKGDRCEIKGMACDTVEQFEKAIITSHHAGIAIQLSNKYLPELRTTTAIGGSPQEFEHITEMTGVLATPFESDQERDILFAWMKLKNDIVHAVDQHNESFIDSEFNGFVLDGEGNYIDTGEHIDIMRNKNLVAPETLKSQNFADSIHIQNKDLFSPQGIRYVNALVHTNNIFLKPPQGTENSSINARAMLEVSKEEGYGDIQNGSPTESLFDRGGQVREGYYVVQGASEEMISHKSQIVLNQFNKTIERLLQAPGVKRTVESDALVMA